MSRTRIVYLIPHLVKAGPVNVLYNTVCKLDRSRFDPVVVALMPPPAKHTKRVCQQWFEAIGVEVVTLNFSNWRMQFDLQRIARELQRRFGGEDVIFHAHGYYPTLLVAKMRLARTMTTIHNICDEDFRLAKGRLMGGYMARCYKRALQRIGVSVAISDAVAACYVDIPNVTLRTVYNGVKVCKAATPSECADARRALALEPSARILLYPAGFSQRKNQQFLIKALQESGREDVVVIFAGVGGTERTCHAMTHGDSRFRFMGYQMDMERLWQAADMMVSSSRSEGFGLIVAEAALHGLPSLLSDIPPHREILEHIFPEEEVNDLCFPLDNPAILVKKLRHLPTVQEDAATIISRASIHYSSQAMAEGYMHLYDEMRRAE